MHSENPTSQDLPESTPAPAVRTAPGLKKQLGLFVAIGVLCAVIDFSVTRGGMSLGLDYLSGKTIGFIAGTAVAYLLNSRHTFVAEASWKRFAAVMALYGVTFAAQLGMWALCWNILTGFGWAELPKQVVGFIIAQGVATTVNFLVQRWVIFRT